jgi:hypothetical protein
MIIANNESYDLAKKFLELKKSISVDNIKEMHILATKLCEDILISHNIFVEGYNIARARTGRQPELSLNSDDSFCFVGINRNIHIAEVIKDFLIRRPDIQANSFLPIIDGFEEDEEESEDEYYDEEDNDDDE